MKKYLFFAIVLAAGVMAFTSCNKKETVESPIVGTWFASDEAQDYFYTFNSNGSYQRIVDYFMNGRDVVAHEHIVGDGNFTVNGDIVTANIQSILVYMDGSDKGDPFDDFWPSKETMKFSVNGNTLTLIHNYETEDEWTEILTKILK